MTPQSYSIALQHDLILVSRDDHFQDIVGLKIEMWQA
jgi:predicted nucleic acid-binding protein